MRGEDYRKSCKNTCVAETPPHAWGRPAFMEFAPKALGNTPTCVGKTQLWPRASAGSEKHPHMRGEDAYWSHSEHFKSETPPHAWGRLLIKDAAERISGNTPTCVGKTHVKHEGPLLVRKHPHMRGEDPVAPAVIAAGRETPPHAWGRHYATVEICAIAGNTPTCVGKTPLSYQGEISLWKHPHMRGEDIRS